MLRCLLLALLFPAASFVHACGYCVEDKIAATYDHAVVAQALKRKHRVAFFHVDGPAGRGAAAHRALAALAASVDGVDRGTVRVSQDGLSLSLAFDPQRAPFARLQAALDRALAPKGLTLMPLRIMESAGDLKRVGR